MEDNNILYIKLSNINEMITLFRVLSDNFNTITIKFNKSFGMSIIEIDKLTNVIIKVKIPLTSFIEYYIDIDELAVNINVKSFLESLEEYNDVEILTLFVDRDDTNEINF